MICPKCKQDMIVVEYHQIELDHCTRCHGVWFDSGELELFLQSANLENPGVVAREIPNSPETKLLHPELKCPVCHHGMKEIAIGNPAIHVDACRQGDGLWFDGGEVHQLLGQLADKPLAKESAQQQITTFLGEVFKAED